MPVQSLPTGIMDPERVQEVPALFALSDEELERTFVDHPVHISLDTKRRVEKLFQALGHETWETWLKDVANEVSGEFNDQIFVTMETIRGLMPVWSDNMGANVGYIRRKGLDVLGLRDRYQGRRALCIGAGPSLDRYQHLDRLAQARGDGNRDVLVATDRVLKPCLERGIVPDVVVTVDGDPVITRFFDHPLVKEHLPEIDVVTTVITNPKTLRYLKKARGLYFFIPWMPPKYLPNMNTFFFQQLTGRISIMDALGHCGGTAYITAGVLGVKDIGLIGCDCGFLKTTKLKDTPYFRAILEKCGGDIARTHQYYTHYYHQCYGNEKFLTDLVFKGYAAALLAAIAQNKRQRTFNATEGGVLCAKFGPDPASMQCITFEQWLQMEAEHDGA